MAGTRLDALFDEAVPRILSATHATEPRPSDGGSRWGMSANLRPGAIGAALLGALTDEVLEIVGPGHWATGATSSSHLTLRPLEPHRSVVRRDDTAAVRYADALERAAAGVGHVRLRPRIGLTSNCVLVGAECADGPLVDLAAAYASALGDDDWFQRGVARDLWNLTLVHFGGPIADARALVDWVAARRDVTLDEIVLDTAQIIHWRFGVGTIHPVVLAEVPLAP